MDGILMMNGRRGPPSGSKSILLNEKKIHTTTEIMKINWKCLRYSKRANSYTLLFQRYDLEDRENKGEEIKNVCRLPNSCVPREFENLFYASTFLFRVPIVSLLLK